ncbi:MAG TPA: zf-TFIIB domain-containing protein [Longimicrobiaceae bacterium]|nr:zf-TFIIB domain-containing protein [Longimicrobiaceae bacterium]
MQAGTLQCPACGAAALADAASCAYCNARLATVACPACFGMVFAGTRFCPHCGAAGERDTSAGDGQPQPGCPRCGVEMKAVAVGSAPVAECGRCGGLWVDVATFDRITTEREQHSSLLAALGGESQSPAPVPLDAVRYSPCPVCGKIMNRVNFARSSGVVVDVCKAHGTWFDADELRRIIEFIRGGGMDRARARERMLLEEERRRMSVDRGEAAAMALVAGPRNAYADPPGEPHPAIVGTGVALLLALRAFLGS